MTYTRLDLAAIVALAAILWRLWWLLKREIRWETRRTRVLRERRWREQFTDWDEINLAPGERLVDGEIMYSAAWLSDAPRHLKAVK